MKKIQDGAGLFFILSVVVLTVVSVFGVWDVFGKDVITKSFQTLGLLAAVAVVVVVAGHFLDGKSETDPSLANLPNPAFSVIRKLTIGVFIAAVAVLAFIGILSIWDMVESDVLSKAISSIGIIAFSSFLVVATCLDREHKDVLQRFNMSSRSIGTLLIVLLLLWWFFGGFLWRALMW